MDHCTHCVYLEYHDYEDMKECNIQIKSWVQFVHIYPNFSLTYFVSLETLESVIEFKMKSCGLEQCSAAQQEFVIMRLRGLLDIPFFP